MSEFPYPEFSPNRREFWDNFVELIVAETSVNWLCYRMMNILNPVLTLSYVKLW
jgi:hypothetical protein